MAGRTGGTGDAASGTLDVTLEMAKVMERITDQLEKQVKIYKVQTELVEALVKAEEAFGRVDGSKIAEITKGLKEARESADGFGKGLTEAGEETETLNDNMSKLVKAAQNLSVKVEFLNGLKAGWNLTKGMLATVTRLGTTGFGLLKNVFGIFLSIPGRILNFFGNRGGGVDEYRVALEEVRKEFGNLEIGTSANIQKMTKTISGFTETTKVGFGRVFGFGRAGLAALLRENLELAKSMGSIFNRMAATIGSNSLALTVLRKATGLSGEAFKTLTVGAEASGRSMESVVNEMSRKVVQAERTFGISSKEIGRDLDAMLKDTATFGRMAPDVMIKTSIYVKKLGISIETLKKVMDKSLNFEDAAQQAASLSEAFNMNIDAMKLMKEQDPTKKMDMIRQSFFATGRSVESLSLQEMKALSNATNLSDEELRLAFSQKNRNLSQAQLNEQMKKGQKQQVTQAEAMQQLAKSIERMVQSGGGGASSFLDRFFAGFNRGIEYTRAFRRVVNNLQRDFMIVFNAGVRVGRVFVEAFPGIKGFLDGIANFLDPRRFRVLMDRVVSTFREFFKSLKDDPVGGTRTFLNKLKETFLNFFKGSGGAAGSIGDSMKSFFHTLLGIAKGALLFLMEQLTAGLRALIAKLRDVFRQPGGLRGAISSFFGGASGEGRTAARGFFADIRRELGPALNDLVAALRDLFTMLWPRIKPMLAQAAPIVLAGLFGPSIMMGIARGMLSALARALGSYLVSSAGPALFSALKGALSVSLSSVFTFGLVAAFAAAIAGFYFRPAQTATLFERLTSGIGTVFEKLGNWMGIALKFVFQKVLPALGLLILTMIFPPAGIALAIGLFHRQIMDGLRRFGPSIVAGAAAVGNALLQAVGRFAVGMLEAFGFHNAARTLREFLDGINVRVQDFLKNFKAYFRELGDDLSTIWKGIKDGFTSAWNSVKNGFHLFTQWFVDRFHSLTKWFVDAWNSVPRPIKALFNTILEIALIPVNLIKLGWEVLMLSFSLLWKGIKAVVKVTIDAIFNIITWPIQMIVAAWDAISPYFETLWKGIKSIVKTAIDVLVNFVTWPIQIVQSAWNAILPYFSNLWEGIKNFFASGANSLIEIVSGPFRAISSFVSGVFQGIYTEVTRDLERIGTWFSEHNPFRAINNAITSVSNLVHRVHGNSLNTIIAHDLNQVNAPAQAMERNLSGAVERGFNRAAQSAARHAATITENVQNAANAASTVPTGRPGATVPATNPREAQETADRVAAIQRAAQAMQEPLTQVLNTFPNLLRQIGEMNIPTNIGEKVKGLSSLFEVVDKIVSIGNSLNTTTGAGIPVNVWHTVFLPIVNLMTTFFTNDTIEGFAGHRFTIERILQGLSTFEMPAGALKNIPVISTLFDFVKKITEVTSSFSASSGGTRTDIWNDIFVPMMGLLGFFVLLPGQSILGVAAGHKNEVDIILQGIASFTMPRGLNEGIARLGRLFDSIKSIRDRLSNVSGIARVNGSITSLNTTFTDLSEMVAIPDTGVTNFTNALDSQGRLLEVMLARLGPSGSITANASTAASVTSNLREVVIRNVSQMIHAYNDFTREMEILNHLPTMDVTLERVGTRLGANRVARIERGSLNVQLNVNVHLEAGQVTQAIFRFHKDNEARPQQFRRDAFIPIPAATTE